MLPIDIEDIYTVSRLNNTVRFLLEDTFPFVWVEGEISNFSAPHSGHWYFSLKDSTAQVRCAMFRNQQRKLGLTPQDGMHVLIKARVSLYENRGDFQLIAETMEERGEGKLQRAFEALKKKLAAAGLFDAAHKKPLPSFPKQIGIITSATGAAIRDILTVLKRRYACLPIVIYPTLVQGAAAAPTIVKAIETANQRNECDVLILARGGGSLEDLWPFNEEIVANAIYNSHLPIISGIGHEVDFTIADFVADLRAPTPSAAAEIATPDIIQLLALLTRHEHHIVKQIQHHFNQIKQQLIWMQKHLAQQHPKRRLLEKMQRLDFCEQTLIQRQHHLLNQLKMQLSHLNDQFRQHQPTDLLQRIQYQLHLSEQQIHNMMITQLNQQKAHLANLATKLHALSPLATLQRGYAIATTQNQQLLSDVNQVSIGDTISVRLTHGYLDCRIEKKYL